MGRYYQGDIEGKFWFGLQPSDAPSRFGGTELEPSYVTYQFTEEDLDDVNAEIEYIEYTLKDKKELIESFFAKNASYNDDDLLDLGLTNRDIRNYADLKLGIQIRDCIIENGECVFDAEL